MCQILWNNIKTQSLLIWKIQVEQTCWFIYYSIGVHVQLMKIIGPYLWFYNVKLYCINIIIILGFYQSNTIRKENIFINKYSTIYHILSKMVFLSTVFIKVFVYNDNVLISKWEVIPRVTYSIISMDCFQKNCFN